MSKHNPQIPAPYRTNCKLNGRECVFEARVEAVSDAPESLQVSLSMAPVIVHRLAAKDEVKQNIEKVMNGVFNTLDTSFPNTLVRFSGYAPGTLTFTHDRPDGQGKILEAFGKIPQALEAALAAFHAPALTMSDMVLDTEEKSSEPPARRIIDPPSRN